MTNQLRLFAIATLYFLSSTTNSYACSVVTVSDATTTTTGYTMDWVGHVTLQENDSLKYLGGGIFLLNSGLKKHPAFDTKSQFTWTSKYKSLVLSTMGPAYGFNGINEAGVEVYLLGPPTLIRDTASNLPVVSEAELVSLLLDTTKNIAEVISTLKSVQVVQQLFPIHAYIKDRLGNVVIVDYKSGLRIHKPKAGEAFLTNHWYDEEQYNWKNRITTDDPRANYIGNYAEKPQDIESVITTVGTRNMTMWQSFSTIQNNQFIYKVRVNTAKIGNVSLTKDVIFNLDELFNSATFPKKTQVYLFSEILKNGKINFRDLENEELRLIQNINLKSIDTWVQQLFSRNAERDQEIYSNFLNFKKTTETDVIDNVVTE